tara:strand:+ start:246 stop:515 length:270 start_codon:yes stop_codon:yes gene_type:complete
MPRPKKKTVGDALEEIKELKQRAAVQRALVAILRTRYLPRDSQEAGAKISCDGAPVQEELIDEIACELEEGADEMEKTSRVYLAEELSA